MSIYIKILLLIIIYFVVYKINHNPEYFEENNTIIYVINLKTRKDRKQQIAEQLYKHKINADFIEAINGHDLNIHDLIKNGTIEHNSVDRILRKGEYGCYLSHINAITNFLKTNKKYCLIFEDDIILGDHFKHKYKNTLSDLEQNKINFDILFLSTNCNSDYNKKCLGEQLTQLTYKPEKLGYGMQSYILSREGAKKIIDMAFPIIYPIDVVIDIQHNTNPHFKIIKSIEKLTFIRDFKDSDTILIE